MTRESVTKARIRATAIFKALQVAYPPVSTFLDHNNTFELLIAVILSAQCTDARVNLVTPALFQRFPTPKAFVNAHLDDIKSAIKSINFFNNKAKNIQLTSELLLKKYNGTVPHSLKELITLPGVGRKTANVILGQAFGIPGITVDTHVKRLSKRLGFTDHDDAVKAEYDLIKRWPEGIWIDMSTLLILHGRTICQARKPDCNNCVISTRCPSKINV